MASPASPRKFPVSLDTWAVLLAFVLAALVRFGVIKTVAW